MEQPKQCDLRCCYDDLKDKGYTEEELKEVLTSAAEVIDARQCVMLGQEVSAQVSEDREPSEGEQLLGISFNSPTLELDTVVVNVVNEQIDRLNFDRDIEARNALYSDRTKITDVVIDRFRRCHVLREYSVNGKPRLDILRERLQSIPLPEFLLFAAEFLGDENGAAMWVKHHCPDGERNQDDVDASSAD